MMKETLDALHSLDAEFPGPREDNFGAFYAGWMIAGALLGAGAELVFALKDLRHLSIESVTKQVETERVRRAK